MIRWQPLTTNLAIMRIATPIQLAIALRLLAMLSFLSLTACFSIESPSRGQPIEARAGQGLIFGRIRVMGFAGEVYFPENPGTSDPLSLQPPTPHLQLMRLGPSGGRRLAVSGLTLNDSDGSFAAWVPAGDYALLAFSPEHHNEANVNEIALLRVPADAVAVYTGDLVITVAVRSLEWKNLSKIYDLRGADVVEGPLLDEQRALEQRYGPLPRPPAVSLWCTGELWLQDPGNAHSRALLDRGCQTSP
jgi:hypothetical protein